MKYLFLSLLILSSCSSNEDIFEQAYIACPKLCQDDWFKNRLVQVNPTTLTCICKELR